MRGCRCRCSLQVGSMSVIFCWWRERRRQLQQPLLRQQSCCCPRCVEGVCLKQATVVCVGSCLWVSFLFLQSHYYLLSLCSSCFSWHAACAAFWWWWWCCHTHHHRSSCFSEVLGLPLLYVACCCIIQGPNHFGLWL